MFTIVIGRDEFGEDPLLLRDEDVPPGGEWSPTRRVRRSSSSKGATDC
jgi:hypothetical protein